MKQMYWDSKDFIALPLLCLLAVMPGCTVGPDFQTPDISGVMQDEWQETDSASGQFDKTRQPDSEWWQQFHDPQLSTLITRLGSSSLALAQARERIVEVTARQGVIGADKRLQLAAALGYTHAETGDEAVSMLGLPAGKALTSIRLEWLPAGNLTSGGGPHACLKQEKKISVQATPTYSP